MRTKNGFLYLVLLYNSRVLTSVWMSLDRQDYHSARSSRRILPHAELTEEDIYSATVRDRTIHPAEPIELHDSIILQRNKFDVLAETSAHGSALFSIFLFNSVDDFATTVAIEAAGLWRYVSKLAGRETPKILQEIRDSTKFFKSLSEGFSAP